MRRSAAFALAAGLAISGPAAAQDAGWMKKVHQQIAANFSYPRSAQLRGDQGTAKVKISYDATGKVTGVELVQTAGSPILDREAQRIPAKMALPAPPTGQGAVVVPITFQLEAK